MQLKSKHGVRGGPLKTREAEHVQLNLKADACLIPTMEQCKKFLRIALSCND